MGRSLADARRSQITPVAPKSFLGRSDSIPECSAVLFAMELVEADSVWGQKQGWSEHIGQATLFDRRVGGRAIAPQLWIGVLLISTCLLYTSDAADERSSVDLGG